MHIPRLPLYTIYSDSTDLCALLLETGAGCNVETKDGLTPMSIAKENEHEDDVEPCKIRIISVHRYFLCIIGTGVFLN